MENSPSAIVIGGGTFNAATKTATTSFISNSSKGIAIGELSQLTNASGGIILGNNGAVTAPNGLILGNSGSVSAASGVLLGNNGSVSASAANGLALGNNTSVVNANAVALGTGSVTEVANKTASTILGGKSYSFAGANPDSTVSIGTAGTSGIKRTLTNLAAGRLDDTSTDGVNGSQLHATNKALNTLFGDVNALADDALLWDASKNAYSATHGTATTNKITNVAAGALNSSSTDAVNGSQLFTTNQNVATNTTNITKNTQAISTLADTPLTFKGNSGSVAKKLGDTVNIVGGASTAGSFSSANISTTVDNQTGNLIIQMADNPVFTSATIGGTAGNTKLDNTGLTITNGPTVTTSGISAGSKKITNVAAAALNSNSTEGVNGSQLYATNQNVASNTTNITNLGNTIQTINNTGTKYFHANSTGTDSNAAGTDSVAIGMGAIATNANDVALGASSVTASAEGTSGAIIAGSSYTFAGVSPRSTVSVGTLNNERTITNLAAGRLTEKSTDAVNGSQLYATNSALNTLNNNVSGLQNDALLWDPTLNAFSASHGTTTVNKITNVKDGDLTANSTDAVNGSQLKTTNDQVATNTQNITQNTKDIGDVDNRVTNIYDTGTKYFHANSTGADSVAKGADSVAIGMGALASNKNDVALGAGSQTSTAVGTATATIAGTVYNFAGQVPDGTLSVGSLGHERTITNVAAGRLTDTSTDAVNGSQLYATNSALNTLNNNVSGLQNDALLWDPTLNAFSASHGTTTVNKITNVKDGDLTANSTDAVNGSQLKTTNDQVATNTQNITQNTKDIGDVDNRVTNIYDTGTKYFHANSTGADSVAKGADSVAIGMGALASNKNDVALGAGSQTSTAVGTATATIAGTVYNFAGQVPDGTLSVGSLGHERTITNVAAGRLTDTSTDAVNGSQLYATNSALNTLNNSVSGLQNDALLWDPTLNAYSASHGTTAVNKITNVMDGELSDTSTDAVNGSQLKATNDQVATNTQNITQNTQDIANVDNRVTNIYDTGTKYFHAKSNGKDSSAIGDDSVAIGMGAVANNDNDIALGAGSKTAKAAKTEKTTLAGTEYYFAGIDPKSTLSIGDLGSERTITNVAAGRLSDKSTDAVNGSQLFATNSAIENIYGDVQGLQNDALLWDPALNAFSASHGGTVINKITNVAEGELSATSTDAVNGSQLYATNVKVENIDNRLIGVEDVVYGSIVPTMRYLKVNSTGTEAMAIGADAVALGQGTLASGDNSVATGNGAQATGNGAIANGHNANAAGAGSVAIGENASVMANNSVALGAGSVADRDNTVSVGAKDNERQITNVAAGTEDTDAVNVAQLKEVSGDVSNIGNTVNNIANGTEGMFQVNNTDNYAKPVVKGNNAVAGGAGSKASGSNSMAIGTLASSTAENSVALGNGSSATATNSVALGANSVADRMNTVSVGVAGGERQITNVAAGTELTDAVNVGQLKQTEANANQYTNNQFKALKNMVNDQKDKLSAGIAGAMAMSGLPQPYSPGASMVGMAGGTYQGQSAIALGVSTISDNGKWVTKLSGSTNSQGDFGAAIGVGYQW
ncbi:YadA-like family protein [Enterobacter ludwigii]|uniref:YadA-like family protein n=1 Tax=Enterobacter ludwigii TaxID=299767 RepID=UPI002A754878|nr:YadA-like family protein [Enterobacter ludwigii]MDY3573370.1 YadA-like family protein [Enterobacter ludwigii]